MDALGRRSGFVAGEIGDDGVAAFATSVTDAHWVDASAAQGADLGTGRSGAITNGPRLATASIVRGPWELRVARLLDGEAARLRISGWPLAGSAPATVNVEGASAHAELAGLHSEVRTLVGACRPYVHTETGTSPLGQIVTVPGVEVDAAPGQVVITAICLTRRPPEPPRVSDTDTIGSTIEVTWPDGAHAAVELPAPHAAG